jgi:holo-[acyl-carrier protein] synthase
MIVGVGVDLCEVARFERLVQRWGDRVLSRLFTDGEKKVGGGVRGMERLAARFAAKEAAKKALGAHLAGTWREVEVMSDEATGAPSLTLHGQARRRADDLQVRASHVSLTHQAGLAVAVVVLES